MTITLKAWTGLEIWSGEAESIRDAVAKARAAGADLREADLRGADLREAILRGADLRGADLREADLSGADLREAILSEAVLRGAILSGADLRGADLSGADLSGAILSEAILSEAVLRGADMRGATMPDGETWEQYLAEAVPALLTAGGKSLEAVLAIGCWDCHDWSNCPMHAAFEIADESEGPILLRPRIRQFVQLFDAGLIPKPEPTPGTPDSRGERS